MTDERLKGFAPGYEHRAEDIYYGHLKGETFATLGKTFNISRSTAFQIFWRVARQVGHGK